MKHMLQELYALEQLAGGTSCLHRLHPAAKLLSTVVFIITVVSFDRYALARLIPFIFYPTLLMALAETPYSLLLKRFAVALPFCLLAGLANLFFERSPALILGGFALSYGALSLLTILLRAYLCVMAVLLLVAITPLAQLTAALRRGRVPAIFVLMFEITYRYLGLLFAEAQAMYTAYRLRGPGQKGIALRHMGSFLGQLLLRAFARAERVYAAMKCRGYDLNSLPPPGPAWQRRDAAFFVLSCAFCLLLRCLDISALWYALWGGLI